MGYQDWRREGNDKLQQVILIDAWDNSIFHFGAVSVPVLSILLSAFFFIATFSMHQEDGKVNAVKVRNNRSETARQAPSYGHEPVSQIVDMASLAPPSRSQQTRASAGFNVLET